MEYPGFVGGTYESRSLNFDCETAINWYAEAIESGHGKGAAGLMRTPGKRVFATLTAGGYPLAARPLDRAHGPIRALYAFNGMAFAVCADTLYQLFADGTASVIGTVDPGSAPCTIDSNGIDLFVVSNPHGFMYQIAPPLLKNTVDASIGGFLDTYFVWLIPHSRLFGISGVEDTTFNPLDKGSVQLGENLFSMLIDHREIWLFGTKTTEIFWNTGNPDFPFERQQGTAIEQGTIAAASPARIDNTVMWLSADERGAAVVVRSQGHTPVRVSNHAVEAAMQGYDRTFGPGAVAGARGFAWQQDGHPFYALAFPAANVTWVYDCLMRMWHRRAYWDATRGVYLEDRARCHCYAFGKHLVGDTQSGQIFEMSLDLYDDAGDMIRRERTAPHLTNDEEWTYYDQFQVDCQAGIGLDGDPGPGTDPQMMMQISNDGGRNFGQEHWTSVGAIGQTKQRAVYRRQGRSRDRAYRIVVTDPVAWAIVNAYLKLRGEK